MTKIKIDPASFKDPDGSVFYVDGQPHRTINKSYKSNYQHLKKSGLYQILVQNGYLIEHKEVKLKKIKLDAEVYKIIKPIKIPFISYPYEWSPSMLKDAALLTLNIQKLALEHDMVLKDATPFNIQWLNGELIFIDTLSFETLEEGSAWSAYRQFCETFLAPLALTVYKDDNFILQLKLYINGIPLDLCKKLLPKRSLLNKGLLLHLHLHSMSHRKTAQKHVDASKNSPLKMNKQKLIALNENLISTIKSLSVDNYQSEWSDYYSSTNYSSNAFSDKKTMVCKFINEIDPKNVWDLGSNEGYFTDLIAKKNRHYVGFDSDYLVVDNYYKKLKTKKNNNILPLVMDLSNPSPPLGFGSNERLSLIDRGPVDCVLALALVHHLYFKYNIAFTQLFDFLSDISQYSIIEYIDRGDSNIKRISGDRNLLIEKYDLNNFEKELKEKFKILNKHKIKNSRRWLYFVKNKK